MKISISSENGGFKLKNQIIEYLKSKEIEVIDVGVFEEKPCNYAEFALKAANLVSKNKVDLGIVICNTGEGVTMIANKVKGVRCALLYNDVVAEEAKSHNNANCIAFGAKFTTIEEATKRIDIFLNTKFIGEPHTSRIKFIEDYESSK